MHRMGNSFQLSVFHPHPSLPPSRGKGLLALHPHPTPCFRRGKLVSLRERGYWGEGALLLGVFPVDLVEVDGVVGEAGVATGEVFPEAFLVGFGCVAPAQVGSIS